MSAKTLCHAAFIRWYIFRPNPILNPLDTGVTIMSYPANLAVGYEISTAGLDVPKRQDDLPY